MKSKLANKRLAILLCILLWIVSANVFAVGFEREMVKGYLDRFISITDCEIKYIFLCYR